MITAAVVDAPLLTSENPVKAWREYRGQSGEELASRSGIGKVYPCQIETAKCTGAFKFPPFM